MRTLLFIFLSAGMLVACGDDGGTDSGTDTSTTDTGTTDTGTMDTGTRPDTSVPTDSGTDAMVDLPVDQCDPFGDDCGADEKCTFVIWNPDSESGEDNTVFYGCVSNDTGTKGEDVICDRLVEVTPGNPDDVFLVPDCAQGLFCWTTLDDSFERCRPMCGLEGAPDCERGAEFCLTLNSDPPLLTCNPLSGCDPVDQSGCDTAEGCYVVGAGAGDIGSRCFEEPVADDAGVPPPGRGDDCMFINSCRPGHQCNGDILADGGTSDTTICHEYCETLADGGMIDAGTCMAAEACVGFPLGPDGGMGHLPRPTGQCQ